MTSSLIDDRIYGRCGRCDFRHPLAEFRREAGTGLWVCEDCLDQPILARAPRHLPQPFRPPVAGRRVLDDFGNVVIGSGAEFVVGSDGSIVGWA